MHEPVEPEQIRHRVHRLRGVRHQRLHRLPGCLSGPADTPTIVT